MGYENTKGSTKSGIIRVAGGVGNHGGGCAVRDMEKLERIEVGHPAAGETAGRDDSGIGSGEE